jgi:hypothetical protein
MKKITFEDLNKAITRKRGNVEDKTNLMTQLQEYIAATREEKEDIGYLDNLRKFYNNCVKFGNNGKDVEVTDEEFEAFEKFKKEYLEKFYK